MREVMSSRILTMVNLLCINLEEAASALGVEPAGTDPVLIVNSAVKAFCAVNQGIHLAITHGKEGSYVFNGMEVHHLSAPKVEAVSTAGAGDAFTAALVAGTVAGLTLREAQQLATLTAARSVTSPDTIDKGLNRASLLAIATRVPLAVTPNIQRLLGSEQ